MSPYSLSNRKNGTTTKERVVRQYFNEVYGTIEHIGDEQDRKGFVFREFVILDEEVIPQPIPFQLCMRDVSLLNGFNVGDKIKVTYRVKCNRGTGQWEDRIFVKLEALRIETADNPSENSNQVGSNAKKSRMGVKVEAEEDSDIAF